MSEASDNSENEFQDALDNLPSNTSRSCEYNSRAGVFLPDIAAAPFASTDSTMTSSAGGDSASVSVASNISTENFPIDASPLKINNSIFRPSSRHGRLELLRNRMRQEFGQPPTIGNSTLDDNLSDCASLASWGRNLLMEQPFGGVTFGCAVVKPTDSLSTRAMPTSSIRESKSREFANECSPGLYYDSKTTAKNSLILQEEQNKNEGIVESEHQKPSTSKEYSFEERKMSLSPPVHPPPPLPNFLLSTPESTLDETSKRNAFKESSASVFPTSPPPRPPPLPPRRTTATLPSALPAETLIDSSCAIQINSFDIRTDINEMENDINFANLMAEARAQSLLKVIEKPVGISQSQQPLQQCSSLSPKRNSSESCSIDDNEKIFKNAMFFDNYGMKRGHAKTNSLDRGLSLAKSMKSGPFPPPSSNKSNSLSRDAAPDDVIVGVCEEDQRNSTAHGVIQQLTVSVLSSAFKKNSKNKGLAVVGEEVASIASSTSFSGNLTHTTKPKSANLINPHYENLTINEVPTITERTCKVQTNENGKTTNVNLGREDEMKVKTEEEGLFDEQITKSNSLPRQSSPSRSMLELKKSKTLHRMESIDPVTRDVQRRMSLSSLDSSQDENMSAHSYSGINHVKNVAKFYGTAASGFFRGVVRRAKTAVVTKPLPKMLASRDNDTGNENESANAEEVAKKAANAETSDSEGDASVSITESISSHLPTTAIVNDVKAPTPASIASAAAPEQICRPRNTKKGPFDFEQLRLAQELNNEHTGAVWCIKFSVCGRLFATGGQDNIIRVWVLKNYLHYFTRMRERYSQDGASTSQNNLQKKFSSFLFMGENYENSSNQDDTRSNDATDSQSIGSPSERASSIAGSSADTDHGSSAAITCNASSTLVMQKPFCVFRGHTADVLDLSWSPRNYFLLSCGIDRTVKLWHLTRNECLCCFQHMDFVTCIAFMPKDDRYFISGCMDGKIRLWHIPEKKVALWNEVEQSKFITAITFVRNAKFVVVGTYNGRCFFYTTDQLRYHTVIDVRSSRGKNACGHKITSLAVHGDKLLITSNDSRIRMYDLRDMNLTRKFKGSQIERSQIRASFSPDGKHIISGSEDNYIYIWRTGELPPTISMRKDRNPMWERTRVHNSVVTAAVFAPKPNIFFAAADSAGLLQHHRNIKTVGNTNANSHPRKFNNASIASSSGIGIDSNSNLSTTTTESVRKRLMDVYSSQGTNLPLTANLTSSLLSNMKRNVDGSKILRSKLKDPSHELIPSTPATGVTPSVSSMSGVFDPYGRASNPTTSMETLGDVIVSADVNGSIKIFLNPIPLKAGSSSFFPH